MTTGTRGADLPATTASSANGSPTRRNLWRHADFLKLWTAATVSGLGDEISGLALPLVAIVTLAATPFEVGLLGTIQFLPFILLTLPAGVWVDRMRRRPILIAGDIGRALALASIPIAFVAGVLTIFQLYVVAFVVGSLTVFFDVAYQSYLPALVDRDQLVEGNSKLEVSRSGVQIAGPAVAGVVIGLVQAPLAIVADAISFIGSALFVFLIRRPEPHVDRHVDERGERRGGMRAEVAEGLRYVLGHSYLRSIAAATALSNLFGNMVFAVLLVYVVREVGLTPELIGLTLSIGNVGVLLGAVLSGRIGRWIGVGPTIVASMALTGPAVLLLAIAPRDAAVPFLAASVMLGGFSAVVYNVNQVSLRQAITPARMQGRMNATMRFIVWGTIPIGSLLGGALGTWLGLRETIWIGAIGSFIAFLPPLLSPVRHLKRIPEAAAESDGDGGPAVAPAEEAPRSRVEAQGTVLEAKAPLSPDDQERPYR